MFTPEVGAVDEELVAKSGLVLDAFKGDFDKKANAFTKSMDKLAWLLLNQGITPKARPLHVLINIVFKGFSHGLFK